MFLLDMKKIALFLLVVLACPELAAQGIDTLFAHVPRKVMPLLDRTSKLDLLDLYNHKLPAKAENTYGGQAEILEKTERYIRLRTTDVGLWQMRLLPAERDTLILCVSSLHAGGTSSRVAVYHRNWMPAKTELPRPGFDLFYAPDSTLSYVQEQALSATLREAPVEALLADSVTTLTYRISTGGLSEEDRALAGKCLHDVRYAWNAGKFVLLPCARKAGEQ